MGILDEAKGRLGEAAEWVKGTASQLGESTQGAGRALGEKAAEARHRVTGAKGGDGADFGSAQTEPARDEPAHGSTADAASHSGGGGDFASEWVDVSTDPHAGGPQADGESGDEPVDGPQNPL
ncbi:hypothetical protein L332_10135 [Agrococcus pavilionensis RW1]|uniref:Uncharacterized protein n=1 Tax=Agrococcus pavilionensis RW1 TaxID=1330458 RepID=U1LQR7_9MICO|nr:hypothetical protein [Agrococcus pavilionensis]ERG64804.1 hypothetical protein L332_10135 [Agrococcus pavilionensis RW1]